MRTGSWGEVQAPACGIEVVSYRQWELAVGLKWQEDKLSGSGKENVRVKGMDVTWEVICWEAQRWSRQRRGA